MDTAGCTDWNSFSPTWGGSAPFQTGTATLGGLTFVGATDAVNSTSDNIYAGGVKQDTVCPGTVTGKANDKADLARIYVAGETLNGQTYLFLSWERQLDTTVQSDVFVSFEFNQGSVSCGAGSPFVKRTKGDLLFDYNFQSGNSTIDAEQWDGTTWQPLPTPPFQAAVNSGTVTDSIGPSGSVSLTKFEFGEAGINLSSLDLTGNGGRACETFGSVLGGSRTSQSGDTAQLKDFVGPAPINLSNCATPTIVTTQEPATGSTSGTFKDKATISGLVTPTGDGTLTFKLYSQKDCKGSPVDTETVTGINANGSYETPTGVTLNTAGTYYWVASFSGDDFNNPSSSGCNDEPVEVSAPGLNVFKSADHSTVNAGDPLGFTITVSNGGPGTAFGVTLKDPLPASTTAAGWKLDSNSGSATCAITGAVGSQELDCSAIDMAANASYTLHISAATSYAACTKYDNTATASASNAPDAQGSDSVQCNKPSLSVTKKADAASVDAGDPLGFTITVSNGGPGTAKGVTLADPLPAGTTGTGWSIDSNSGLANCVINGPVGSQELDCSAIDLASGHGYVLHISAATSFEACTVYDNTATASASNAPDAQGSDSITCSPAQVSITKTADHSGPVNAGDAIGFTVEVKNSGSGAATGVKLADPLPAGSGSGVTWAIDSSTGTPSRFVLSGAAGSQTLSLASATLPAGADYKVHITADTSQTECGTYDNTATLTTGNAGNPSPASAEESCAFQVDLAITKSGSPARQEGLGNITWTMVVTNNGPDTDTGVNISDPIPAGTTFVSAQSSQGTCTGGAILHCAIGTMTAGQKVTITLVTTPTAAGTITNTVVVMGDRPETTLSNNTATASVVVVQPHQIFCVAVSRLTPGHLIVGRKTTLTIHLTRHGQAVKGIRVRIKGPKLNTTTKRSNSKGVIKKTVKLKKKGILTVTPLTSPSCGTKRIGVRGIFTPPVTG